MYTNTKKYISGVLLSVLFLSNTLTGTVPSLSMNTVHANSSPYELKKIVYDGGVEEFESGQGSGSGNGSEGENSSEDNENDGNNENDENMLDLNDWWDMRFIEDHLYVFYDGSDAKMDIYDRDQNLINSVSLESGIEGVDASYMFYDETAEKIVIEYYDSNNEESTELRFYNLDGTFSEAKDVSSDHVDYHLGTDEWVYFEYSPADKQVVAINEGEQKIEIMNLDGEILHTFLAEDFGEDGNIYIYNILPGGYIIRVQTDSGVYDKYLVNSHDASITALSDTTSIATSPFSSYIIQVTNDTHIMIRDNDFNELHSFDIDGDWTSAWSTVYYPASQHVVLIEYDGMDTKISIYDINTGKKVHENTDFSDYDNVWFAGFDANTGIIYVNVGNGSDDRGMYKYDPTSNTMTLIYDGFDYDNGYGDGEDYGYGYGDEEGGDTDFCEVDCEEGNTNEGGWNGSNDNFNSVKLDAEKNLVIAAGGSVKTLTQSGSRMSVQHGERSCIGEHCRSLYPYYTDTEKYRSDFAGLDGSVWDIGDESNYTEGSTVHSFHPLEYIGAESSNNAFDPQGKTLINQDGVLINNKGYSWNIFQNNGTYTGTASIGSKYRIKISDNYIIYNNSPYGGGVNVFNIYDLNGNFVKTIAGGNSIYDNYITWGDTIYYFHDNGTNIILSSVNIEDGIVIEELSFSKITNVEYHVGHIEASGILYFGKINRSGGNPPGALYTYDLVNKVLTTVHEGNGAGSHDFLILNNGNIVSKRWNNISVIDEDGYYVGGSEYRFYNSDISIFPVNNGFITLETATASPYSAPYVLKRIVSLYDNSGNLVRVLYTGNHISGSLNGVVDENGNILFTDEYYLYSIDPEGNITQKHRIGDGGGGIMRHPLGMTTNKATNEIFVSDTENRRIVNLQQENMVIGFGELSAPSGIDISPLNGDIYVVDSEAQNIRIYGQDGTNKGVFISDLPLFTQEISCNSDFTEFYTDNSGDLSGKNCIPVGLTIDNAGKVYISHDKWVRVYNADGTPYAEINETTHPEAFESHSFLRGIDVDDNGDIYVVDSSIDFIRTIPQPEPVGALLESPSSSHATIASFQPQETPSLFSKILDVIDPIPSTYAQSDEGNSGDSKINRILVFSLTDNTDDSGNNGNGGGENNGNGNEGNPSNPTPPVGPGGGSGGSSYSGNSNKEGKGKEEAGNPNTGKKPKKETGTLNSAPDEQTTKLLTHVTPTERMTEDGKAIYSLKNPLTENICTDLVQVYDIDELLARDTGGTEFKGYIDILTMFRALEKDEDVNGPTFTLYRNDGVVLNNDLFKGGQGITRAEFTKILVRSLACHYTNEGNNTVFSDIDPNMWYAPYIQFAYKKGWINGYSDNTFRPDAEISRQEASKILARAIGLTLQGNGSTNADLPGTGTGNGTGTETENGNTPFSDIDPNSEFLPYINALREAKVLSGKTSTLFDPTGNISRNEAGKIVGKVFFGEE